MACAAILSLEEFRDTQRCAAIRQRLHDRLDHWLDMLEAHVKNPQPTLEELTQAVTEGLVEQAHRAALEQRTVACPLNNYIRAQHDGGLRRDQVTRFKTRW